tara:strand:+ start:10444 stop:11991 length:1548 start_codon:yes stop_codon:yes gene_type:complete
MLKKVISYILVLYSLVINAQLNQEPKRITNKFFSELNNLENITPALIKKKGFTNYQELLAYIDKKVEKYPDIVSSNFIGKSQKGKKIPIIYLKRNKNISSKKVKIWMQGGLHGNEPASTESLLYLIHLILEDSDYNYLLDKIDLAILPMANIDGFLKNNRYAANGLDLNRDHTKIMAPETKASKRAFAEFDPHIALDFHEYRPFRKDFSQLSTFGISNPYDVMFLHTGNLNVPENIREIIDTLFVKNAKKSLDKLNLRHRHYIKSEKFKGEIHFSTGSNTARSSSNFYALNNGIATLFEIRGVGIGKTSFKRRINSGLAVGFSFLKTAYENSNFIFDQIDLANTYTDDIVLQHERSIYSDIIKAIDIESNELIDFETTMHSSKDSYAISKIDRPIAYIIKKNDYGFIEKLKDVGVDYVEFENDTIIFSGGYRVIEFNNKFKVYEKMKMQKVITSIEYNDNKFSKGDILISMKQKRSNLIAELLEPEAPNSYVSFGIIKTSLNNTLPIYRIKNLNN